MRRWAGADGGRLGGTVVVGDGANDRGMIAAAGLGVACCAKPAVVAAAPAAVHVRDLRAVLELLGDAPAGDRPG